MSTLRDGYRTYLNDIARQTRQNEAAAEPPASDEETTELVTAFHDAVLSLYNNALRVCGVPVGDADSESNSMMIRDRLGRSLDEAIAVGLAETRQAQIEQLEWDEKELAAQIITAKAAAEAACREADARGAALAAARQKQADIAKRIRTLKELV